MATEPATETKTETKLKLDPPDALQTVAPAEAAGLVPPTRCRQWRRRRQPAWSR